MSAPADTHLVIERDGQLWAVPGAAVDRLARRDGRVAVRLRAVAAGGEEELAADRLLAVAGELAVVPAPAALARYWSEPAAGLALFERRPVVVIDPARPPRALGSRDEASRTAEGADGRDDVGT